MPASEPPSLDTLTTRPCPLARSKQQLFRAVFEELEGELTAEIAAAPDRRRAWSPGWVASWMSPTTRGRTDRPLTDAAAVLGWQTWRQIEARHGLA
jgi:hypothetical protein